MAGSSNGALLVRLVEDGTQVHAVYKPTAHERPLNDFPMGTLAKREVAAWLVDQVLGWDLVPTTVWRESGPRGPGMLQLLVPEPGPTAVAVFRDDDVPLGWRSVLRAVDEDDAQVTIAHLDDPTVRKLVAFDLITNNADRKAGHALSPSGTGRIMGVDHGLTFNVDDKLRTVFWGFAGEEVAPELIVEVDAMLGEHDLWTDLQRYLTLDEIAVTRDRVEQLLSAGRYPMPPVDRAAIPWPLF